MTPIDFKSVNDINNPQRAAYLSVRHLDRNETVGALFIVNSLGSPIEFTYNSVEIKNSFLWRKDDLIKSATAKLAGTLFTACKRKPSLLVCLADEISVEIFRDYFSVDIPVCFISDTNKFVGHSKHESSQLLDDGEAKVHLLWLPDKPPAGSPQLEMLNRLASVASIKEPFKRIEEGLKKAFKDKNL